VSAAQSYGRKSSVPPLPVWLRVRSTGVEVRVRLIPNASRDCIDGLYGDRLKIKLTAQPIAGEANEALVRFLAKAARVAPSRGRVVAGPRERSKTVLLESDAPAATAQRLREHVAAAAARRR
jgi:uncharacterized protein (TIGR00251 family)